MNPLAQVLKTQKISQPHSPNDCSGRLLVQSCNVHWPMGNVHKCSYDMMNCMYTCSGLLRRSRTFFLILTLVVCSLLRKYIHTIHTIHIKVNIHICLQTLNDTLSKRWNSEAQAQSFFVEFIHLIKVISRGPKNIFIINNGQMKSFQLMPSQHGGIQTIWRHNILFSMVNTTSTGTIQKQHIFWSNMCLTILFLTRPLLALSKMCEKKKHYIYVIVLVPRQPLLTQYPVWETVSLQHVALGPSPNRQSMKITHPVVSCSSLKAISIPSDKPGHGSEATSDWEIATLSTDHKPLCPGGTKSFQAIC